MQCNWSVRRRSKVDPGMGIGDEEELWDKMTKKKKEGDNLKQNFNHLYTEGGDATRTRRSSTGELRAGGGMPAFLQRQNR